jgi:hypothetical protein
MAFQYEFAFRPAVGQLTASGAPSLAEWRMAIGALIRHPDLPADAPLLLDLRSVDGLPRSRDGGIAVREWLQLVPARRVAFVAGRRTALQIASELWEDGRDGFEVFTGYKLALMWLVFNDSCTAPANCWRSRLLTPS